MLQGSPKFCKGISTVICFTETVLDFPLKNETLKLPAIHDKRRVSNVSADRAGNPINNKHCIKDLDSGSTSTIKRFKFKHNLSSSLRSHNFVVTLVAEPIIWEKPIQAPLWSRIILSPFSNLGLWREESSVLSFTPLSSRHLI